MVKSELQDDVQPVFKKKRHLHFVSLEQINEELDRLVKKTWVLSKLEYSEGVAPTIYEKRNLKRYTDFSTG